MKAATQSFYAAAVQRTVDRIVHQLDEALDLTALAKEAALSPFHFHRVFRGMVGETPLELHRRLRMERAALQLLQGDEGVTAIAFEAGYDTHEAFTRAFRAAYGVPPSEFRRSPAGAGQDCVRPRQTWLTSRSGIHFQPEAPRNAWAFPIPGGHTMDVVLKELPALRLATVPHVGAYSRISEAFQKLGQLAGAAGLLRHAGGTMLAVYHDEPESTPQDQLRSEAAVVIPDDAVLPEVLGERRLPAGRYASTVHVGPYTELGDAWARLMGQWLPDSGHRVGEGVSFEIYRNNPMQVPPAELRTELYVPLA
ncbi:AraC family transcriptional regulator [Corallococcus sp. AB011P]|uniref:AraC family transcriptional regulator n=1 Tax=unclassified Corallococcus TaxID=2685029 RepID=UPI000EA0163D|nr:MULTISPECIES: AraC family transcriptional regulator [unclassified Corallococcus]RKG56473.1 AraC family transcriptional regulator [Corallococcus sp. AB011P]RKH81558.1 AraC family transcriptional regulator [Corallococcus sp. AB045]